MNWDIFKNQKENKIIKDNQADFAISFDNYKKLKDTSNIKLEHREIIMSPLTIGFVKFFLDASNYKRLKDNFSNDDRNNVKLCIIKNNELDVVTEFSKVDIVNALVSLTNDNLLNSDEVKKYNELKNLITFDKLMDNTKDKKIKYKDKDYKVRDIIALLAKEPDSFMYTIENGVLGLNKNDLCKLLNKYIFDSSIKTKYYLTDNMYKNIFYIKKLDIYYYGEIKFSKKPKYFNQIKINPKFKHNLLSLVPSTFNKFEKIFYIYYLLCTKLVYDEEQMVNKNFGYDDYTIDHTKLSRISKIDENNNKVLCFEFNAIFAKILEELNIEYELTGEEKYASGHVGLRFLVDNLIVSADSTEHGVVYSDMAHAKNDVKLEGFNLLNNEDEEALKAYNESINKVYKYIEEYKDIKIDKFNDKIETYKKLIKEPTLITDKEKLKIYLDKVNKCKLYSSDKIEYYLTLQKALFPTDGMLDVFFVKNNKPQNKKYMVVPTIIIVYKDKINDTLIRYRYFIQEENELVNEISLSSLRSKFINAKYEYTSDKFDIPGIDIRKR